ncbi:MAG: LptA/OstA family protein [Candidatus Marinarcus sp.]|uniref:LptA/OstA family protein n=1 Tax=Candidatus Marinarcus sp. TaxID=3100987 RepID=UPI003B00FECA
MKFLFCLLVMVNVLFAAEDKLIIDANKFEAYDQKGIAIFTGDVKMTRIKDKLDANEVIVYLTPNPDGKAKQKEPLKYVATGDVSFEIYSNLKHYTGKGDKVIYLPKESKYEIIGNGYLKEINEDKTLSGDVIYINQVTGEATVKGSKDKPVRFILNIESKKQ